MALEYYIRLKSKLRFEGIQWPKTSTVFIERLHEKRIWMLTIDKRVILDLDENDPSFTSQQKYAYRK